MGKRARLSKSAKLDIVHGQNGKCKRCSVDLSGVFEIDHVIPHSIVGENTPLQALCPNCHAVKSRHDNRRIRELKAKALEVETSDEPYCRWYKVCTSCGDVYDDYNFPKHTCSRFIWDDNPNIPLPEHEPEPEPEPIKILGVFKQFRFQPKQ